MIKVFLVEDEFVVREGIKNNIDWKAQGYEFAGEAGDGELAFPMIQKAKPDIVITDIRMPFMDGLELSRRIKKELPGIEIIILSGYEEFEYAKEGIRLGVAEYLLKPISGEDLLKAVNKIAVRIEERRREQEIREKYALEMEGFFEKERGDLFRYLVTGTKTVSELLELADRLQLDLSAMWYNIVLFRAQSTEHGHGEYCDSLVEAEQKFKKLEDGGHLLLFDRNLEGEALLFKADSREELEAIQTDYLEQMKNILADYEHISYFGGIGEPVNRLTELPVSFEKASHVFAHRYLLRNSGMMSSEDVEEIGSTEEEDFSFSHVDMKLVDRSRIREFLRTGNGEEAIYFVEELFKDLSTGAMKSTMFRQYLTMDAYFCVVDFVEGMQLSREEIETIDITSGTQQGIQGTIQYVVRIIRQALELREKAASNRYGDVVEEMTHYIEEHYAEEELSLNLLASHVNFSPNHLSMIFSQQTGQTFIKYLTDYRMNKARELLRCTGKRSSSISMEVGYRDPHYFSYLFRKTQGMTPTQYRGGKTIEGEEE